MACPSVCLGDLKTPIEILRRRLLTPMPGQAAPRHDYEVAFSCRAQVKTKAGASMFAAVEINGKRVTHVFTMRFTTLPIDTRDRVRDVVGGSLFQILSVEEVDMERKWLRLQCAITGPETVEAAR